VPDVPAPTPVPTTAAPSEIPTSVPLFDPPNEEDCAAIANGDALTNQEGAIVNEFNLMIDVTFVPTSDTDMNDALMDELMNGMQQNLMPSLVGCVVEDIRRLGAPVIRGSRKLQTSLRYVILNAIANGEYLAEESCEEDAEAPCYRVSVNLQLFLKEETRFFTLVNFIAADFDGSARPLVDRLGLADPFKKCELVGVSSLTPTEAPTPQPSSLPSVSPTMNPTASPTTPFPTATPSASPTRQPVVGPTTESPTKSPTKAPTLSPTNDPTAAPVVGPTPPPTTEPPTNIPRPDPSPAPVVGPSFRPSMVPSFVSSMVPSMIPSEVPSFRPSMVPSSVPFMDPSPYPSSSPTAYYLGCFLDNELRDLTIFLKWESNLADCVDRCGAIGYAYAGLQVRVSFCLLYCSYYAIVAFDSMSSRSVVSINAFVEIRMEVSVLRTHAQRLATDPHVAEFGRTASIGPIHRIQ
jgi:hypothetical protein